MATDTNNKNTGNYGSITEQYFDTTNKNVDHSVKCDKNQIIEHK